MPGGDAMPLLMVELLLDAHALLGESPRWHPGESRLYWVDIDAHSIHRTDPTTRRTETVQLDGPVGCIAPRAGGGLVAGLKDGCALIDVWGRAPRPFGQQVLAHIPEQRFNDGCVDAAGRLWVGSMTRDKTNPAASLYRLDPDGSLTKMLGGLLTSNGAAFSPDGRTFYHADTPTHALRAYAVDPATGMLGEGRLFHQFETGTGRPDGGTP